MNWLYALMGSPISEDTSGNRGSYNPWTGTVRVDPTLDPMWWNEAYGHESQHRQQYKDNPLLTYIRSAIANGQLKFGNPDAYWYSPHEVEARQAGTNYLKDMYQSDRLEPRRYNAMMSILGGQ